MSENKTYKFFVWSEQYGETEFGPYKSIENAEEEIRKIKQNVKELKDGIRRFYSDVVEAQNDGACRKRMARCDTS